MDIKKYIISGILEQYVIGNLFSDREVAEVEKNAAQYPEIRTEIIKIEKVLELLANAGAITPPAGLKEKILNKITALERPGQVTDTSAIGLGRGQGRNLYIQGTLLLFLLGTLAFGIVQWQIANNLRSSLGDLSEEYIVLKENCDEVKNQNEQLENMLKDVNDPNTIRLRLTNPDNEQNFAMLYWNPEKEKSFLEFSDIEDEDIPPGKQYELWAIDEDGAKSMGVIGRPVHSGDSGDFVFVPFRKDPKLSYGITVEDAGGSRTGVPNLAGGLRAIGGPVPAS